jgi:ABC-type transport system substrate-binding protein/predicted small lipoprotein YifL
MKRRTLASLLALTMVVGSLTACGKTAPAETTEPQATEQPTSEASTEAPAEEAEEEVVSTADLPSSIQQLEGKEYGEDKDYVSLYDKFGKQITIADVTEDESTGLAYLNVDGQSYELGLDFLSMAMVYNTSTEGTDFATEDDVYAEWWKYYITRWNHVLPEIPLYSNEYYDVYNAQIKGVDTHPTNPYWGPALALIDWTSEKDDNSIILGNTTDLSGKFRFAVFGGSNPGASDHDIQRLVNGLEPVAMTKEGGYEVNKTVVDNLDEKHNDDGSLTYTVKIKDDLVFSDGSPITAKNYLYRIMAFSTPVAAEAEGKDRKALMQMVGFEDFAKYDGTNDGVDGATKVMKGVRLIDDYTFSLTIDPQYLPYFYAITYLNIFPTYKDLWVGDCDLVDDGEGVYFTDDFYAKNGDSYVMAKHITDSANNTDTKYPYAGPYVVKSYDASDKSAVLELNPNFKGNYEGVKPTIEKVVYKKIISETQLEDFKAGGVDVLSGITGGSATDEAIALADGSDGKYVYTHYSRAGYGKLGFRCDYGPVQYPAVRQAIAYCMDRATFAKDFTGGYGGVVDGPYYAGSWMYKKAVEQGMLLDAYDTSVDSAIEVLENDGWVYNAEGGEYTEGVRYKKISGEYATEKDKNYQSIDGAYKTVEINGDYYMPLALNWYGTVDNEFSDLLVTGFEQNDNIASAGFTVQKTTGDFGPMLDELYQAQVYGYYSGTPMYTCFNFATGFTSAVYDYSFLVTIDPSMYDDNSNWYIKDAADIYWN